MKKVNYAEIILSMVQILKDCEIFFDIKPCFDGWQLVFPEYGGDVAIHSYTRGADRGYVESYRFPWDNEDTTMLTPFETLENICELYGEF